MNLKWGIIGLGKIAHRFCKDLQLVDRNELIAVGSRSLEKAKEFGALYKAPHCYGDYAALMNNQDVDIIYIATPHNSHMKYSLQAMQSGKHVLCEKPLAINRSQVQLLVDCARENKVFLMEAFWSRFNPSIERVLELVKSGEIGEVNYINADFTFYTDAEDDSRMLNMDLAGGSLLDVGVYPLFLAYALKGMPDAILAAAIKHSTGADVQTSAILKYKNGLANLMSGFRSHSDMIAKIYGTEGKIFIDRMWHEAQGFRLEKDEEVKSFSLPTKGKGFTYEIEECRKCISNGWLESKKWSHSDSLNLISMADEIRKQCKIKYPFE